jgi:hypothetical protein
MDDMKERLKEQALVGGLTIATYLFWRWKTMDDDIDIPEFMKPERCDEPGCMKKAIPKVGKCLECAMEALLPQVYDDLDEITKKARRK